jgi:hypothetical protein
VGDDYEMQKPDTGGLLFAQMPFWGFHLGKLGESRLYNDQFKVFVCALAALLGTYPLWDDGDRYAAKL